jgi:hypothetical protein
LAFSAAVFGSGAAKAEKSSVTCALFNSIHLAVTLSSSMASKLNLGAVSSRIM